MTEKCKLARHGKIFKPTSGRLQIRNMRTKIVLNQSLNVQRMK